MLSVLMLLIFILKVAIVCIWLIIIRGTLPRYRLDVLSVKAWKEWVLLWVCLLLINTALLIILS